MWQIKIHKLVEKEDFKKISPKERTNILRAIKRKLSLAPEKYGKPLSGEFKGYWKLRVENYRVIYKIKKAEVQVFVIKIGIRRNYEVYEKLLIRLKRYHNNIY